MPLALMLSAACAGKVEQAPPSPAIQTLPSTGANTDTGGTDTAAADPLCGKVRIVELSRYDTDETKRQVIANNAVIAAVCGVG